MPDIYLSSKEGSKFDFHEYLPVPSAFAGLLAHFFTNFALAVLSVPGLPGLLKRLVPEAGTGPDLVAAKEIESQVFRAVSVPQNGEDAVEVVFEYKGSLYYCSAAIGVEAARVVLGEAKTVAHELGGGVLTPATLGMEFVERVRGMGVKLEVVSQ